MRAAGCPSKLWHHGEPGADRADGSARLAWTATTVLGDFFGPPRIRAKLLDRLHFIFYFILWLTTLREWHMIRARSKSVPGAGTAPVKCAAEVRAGNKRQDWRRTISRLASRGLAPGSCIFPVIYRSGE
jgi:hypothetical protein